MPTPPTSVSANEYLTADRISLADVSGCSDYFFQASVADALITYEGPWSNSIRSDALSGSSRMSGVLIYDPPEATVMSRLRSLVRRVSLIYFTDDTLISFELSPWDILSS